MVIDIRQKILNRVGKGRHENIRDYLERMRRPQHKDCRGDSSSGICPKCGWVDPRATCSDCGKNAVEHVGTFIAMIDTVGVVEATSILREEGFAVFTELPQSLTLVIPPPSDNALFN